MKRTNWFEFLHIGLPVNCELFGPGFKMQIVSRIYRFLWLTVHLLFMLSLELLDWVLVVWNHGSQSLWSCWPERSIVSDCGNIAKYSQLLKKHPKHIAFLVTPEEADGRPVGILQKLKFLRSSLQKPHIVGGSAAKEHRLDFDALTRLVTWAWAANIPVISLYDYHGKIKGLNDDLIYGIQDEMEHNLSAVQKHRPSQQIPKLRLHNVTQDGTQLNNNDSKDCPSGRNGVKPVDTLHILLFTSQDGKARIIDIAKDICKDSLLKQSHDLDPCPAQIKEAELDTHFRYLDKDSGESSVSSDPDMLVIIGNVKSTLGFLPWNIRLSEMFWVPKLPLVSSSHFLNVLETYSGCQQRFGT